MKNSNNKFKPPMPRWLAAWIALAMVVIYIYLSIKAGGLLIGRESFMYGVMGASIGLYYERLRKKQKSEFAKRQEDSLAKKTDNGA